MLGDAPRVGGPVRTLPGLVAPDRCRRWSAAALEALGRQAAAGCSLRLRDVPRLAAQVLSRLGRDTRLGALLASLAGPHPQLLADQCWLRHQPAPRRRAATQTPHHWHQDGALGFPFAQERPPYPADALLPMWTCWIPLVECGDDAPSLTWSVPTPARLLAPMDLPATALRGDRHHAVLGAGDALLFDGALLHATHAHDAMQGDRTSIELRWLPGTCRPPRLAGETRLPWPPRRADPPNPDHRP